MQIEPPPCPLPRRPAVRTASAMHRGERYRLFGVGSLKPAALQEQSVIRRRHLLGRAIEQEHAAGAVRDQNAEGEPIKGRFERLVLSPQHYRPGNAAAPHVGGAA